MANTITNSDSNFKQDVRDLGQGVGAIKEEVKNLAGTAVNAARHGASELKQTAYDVAGQAKEKLVSAKDAAMDATESMKGCVTRNPLTSVAIAAAAGLVVGMLICRRN